MSCEIAVDNLTMSPKTLRMKEGGREMYQWSEVVSTLALSLTLLTFIFNLIVLAGKITGKVYVTILGAGMIAGALVYTILEFVLLQVVL